MCGTYDDAGVREDARELQQVHPHHGARRAPVAAERGHELTQQRHKRAPVLRCHRLKTKQNTPLITSSLITSSLITSTSETMDALELISND